MKVTLNLKLEPKNKLNDYKGDSTPFGAGVGVWVGLQKLFNDQNEEAKLLAFQFELLKKHLGSL